MTDVIIRNAKIQDFDQLVVLFQQLQPKVKIDKKKTKNFFQKILKSKFHFAWVAVTDGKVIGYMDVVFRTYHFAFDFVARIETTIVDENYRKQGVATKLIKKCEAKAKEEKCKVIELDSAMNREGAHEFYESNGYTKRGYLFWKKF